MTCNINTCLLNYVITYLLTYLPTSLLTHLITYLLNYLLTHLLTCLLTYLLTYLITYLLTHSLTHLLISCKALCKPWPPLSQPPIYRLQPPSLNLHLQILQPSHSRSWWDVVTVWCDEACALFVYENVNRHVL